ncbi:MAG: HAMP domain-containing protein [Deltaproteobacteria bacterium]|nr:MAG: HAMP domain-containing protein [Deltaproteobacteria bacterium]
MKRNTPEARSSAGRTLAWKIMGVLATASLLPLLVGGGLVIGEIEILRRRTSRIMNTFERRAEKIARNVSSLLFRAERDLEQLERLPRKAEAYQRFAREKTSMVWIRAGTDANPTEQKLAVPLYKEVSFIGTDGRERILVVRGEIVDESRLRDVSRPENTTYRCERYFDGAMKRPGELYVSHLNGFHVNRIDALGIEKLITHMKKIPHAKRLAYRYLLYEMLRAASEVEFAGSYKEGSQTVLVYRRLRDGTRVLVEHPPDLTTESLQARNLELRQFIESLAPEDTVEGRRYDGVIRFAKAVRGPDGKIEGVVSIALDHLHLSQLVQHVKAMELDAVVFAGYRDADYTYLFDDEGWIITHPKAWNIRGVDWRGRQVPPYSENTTEVERLVGKTPVNLLRLDWKMGEGYHQLVLETRKGRTGIATSKNLAGVLRTRIYTPVFYDRGAYSKHGIFGGVLFGTRVDKFIGLLRKLGNQLAGYTTSVLEVVAATLAVTVVAILLLGIFLVRRLVHPIRLLTEAAMAVASGNLEYDIPDCGSDEIGQLAVSFRDMTAALNETIEQLKDRNLRLQKAQKKLVQVERQKRRQLEQQLEKLEKQIADSSFANMVAESPAMKKVKEEIARVAPSSATVLLLGENGTGKELVAEAIHRNSTRRNKPFVKINCAAFNDNLLESELFGHAKGAYTGAIRDRKGLFETADGGTLMLDEVGDMSLNMQKKLLRVLQEGEIVPLGSNRVVKVDVRIIAATNRDLHKLMEQGQFREDLFHRLNVITIHIPPLRERKEDILPIARYFLARFCEKEGKPGLSLGPEAEEFLMRYHWPGNVRELENAVERAVIRCMGDTIIPEDFQLDTEALALPEQLAAESDGVLTLEELEKRYILSVLEKNNGNKKETARQLGIGYNTLWRKLKKYGMM